MPPCETPNVPEAGYTALFDGTDASLEQFKYSGSGSFVREGCTIKSVGGFGLMYTKQSYKAPYSLKLDWMMPGDDNSGIFVGFPDTGANTVDTSIPNGEEIQIDPTDNPAQTTGAIYLEQAADLAARDAVLKPAGQWNSYELIVKADRIIVMLNGVKINEWIDDDPVSDLADGHIGLQMHGAGDDVFFRNVRVKSLEESVQQDTTLNSTVPATLALSLGGQSSFGTFIPNVDRTYEASTTANVISTAGDAKLSVSPEPGLPDQRRVHAVGAAAGRVLEVHVDRTGVQRPGDDLVQAAHQRHAGVAYRQLQQDADVHPGYDQPVVLTEPAAAHPRGGRLPGFPSLASTTRRSRDRASRATGATPPARVPLASPPGRAGPAASPVRTSP